MIEKPRRTSSVSAGASARRRPPQRSFYKPAKPVKKINAKLLGAYALAIYAFIALIIIYFSYSSYDAYMERKRLEIEASSYEIEMSFSNTLSHAESVLNYINHQISISKATNDEISNILSSFNQSYYDYDSIKEMLSVGMFYWVDSQRHLVISSAGPIVSPIDLSSRDYLENTEKTPWKICTGAPVVGAVSGQNVIPAGVGVVNADNKYIGTTVVSFKLDNLIEKFRNLTAHYKVDFAILDIDNKVLMESEVGLFSQNNNLMSSLKVSDSSLHREMVSKFSPFNQKGSYIVVRNVEKYPYKILVGYKNGLLTREVLCEILPHLVELLIFTIFFVAAWVLVRLAIKRHVTF